MLRYIRLCEIVAWKIPMISIFSTFKPFKAHNRVIQLNALRSWLRFCPPCEIIALGDDEGVAEVAREHGIRHIPEIEKNEFGTPVLSSIIDIINKEAKNDIVAYVNGDIIILGDMLNAVRNVKSHFENFLILGRRYNIRVEQMLDFEAKNWELDIREKIQNIPAAGGPDIMIFKKGVFKKAPPVAIGRGLWTRFFVFNAYKIGIPVIDATYELVLIHQIHGYHHVKSVMNRVSGSKRKRGSSEGVYNRRLMGRMKYFLSKYYHLVLSENKLKPVSRIRYSFRRLTLQIFLDPRLRSLLKLLILMARHRKIRRLLEASVKIRDHFL